MNLTTQTVERDPETGLAALPDGYLWRVHAEKRYLTLKLVRVSTETKYRAKWLFFGSEAYTERTEKVVKEEYYDSYQLISSRRTKDEISRGLAKLSDEMYTEWSAQQRVFDTLISLAGDYPPKNLNSV
jgi:hypothetical protein